MKESKKQSLNCRVLVLGGTGAMGTHLVNLLNRKGYQVTVTSRRMRDNFDNVTYVTGNAHESSFLNSLLASHFDVIVDFMVYSTGEFAQRCKTLLKSCGQYIYLSSSRVYADSSSPITENSARLLDVCMDKEFLATDEYALTKARQEDLLRQSGYSNYTIIRPYITFSEIRLQLGVYEKENWLYRALQGRTIVFSKDIADKYTTLTYGLNVAEGIASLIGQSDAYSEAFHITANESHRWDEILQSYLHVIESHTGKRPKVLILEKCPKLALPLGQYQVKYDRYYNRRFSNEKINRFIDTTKFLPTLSGLEQCLETFIKSPTFRYINWRNEAKYDRWTNEKASLKELGNIKKTTKYLLYRYLLTK